MRRKVELKYYVINGDVGKGGIEEYNVLRGISEYIYKNRKKIKSHEELKEMLKGEFKYHYWSRAEYEVIVGGLGDKYPEEYEKIDIWRQIEPNLEVITKYIEGEMRIEYDK